MSCPICPVLSALSVSARAPAEELKKRIRKAIQPATVLAGCVCVSVCLMEGKWTVRSYHDRVEAKLL